MPQNTRGRSICRIFFTSDLFDLLILIRGVHCYIVLVSWHFVFCLFVFFTSLQFFVLVSNQVSWVTAYWILSSNKVKLDIKVFSKVPFRKWWYRVEICVVCFKLVFVSDVTILWPTLSRVVNRNSNEEENSCTEFSNEVCILKESSCDGNFVDDYPVREVILLIQWLTRKVPSRYQQLWFNSI